MDSKQQSETIKIRTIPISRVLTGLLITVFGLFALIVSLFMQSSLESDFGEIRRQDFDRRMAAYATLLNNFIDVHSSLVQDVSKDAMFAQSVMQPDAMLANLSDHMSRLRVLGEHVQMTLLAFDGTTIHSSLAAPTFNYRNEAWVAQIMDAEISNYFGIHKDAKEYYLTFATAIYYNGQPEGVLLTEIPAKTLATHYQWVDDLQHEQLQLYHNDELIISMGSAVQESRAQSTIELATLNLSLAGYLDGSGLHLISEGILRKLVIVIFLLALLGIIATLFVSHKLFIRPLDSLRKAADLVAKGQFRRRLGANRNVDILPTGYRLLEISNLRNDIAAMAETIVLREQSLIDVNTSLEQRVLDRTRELEAAHDQALVANRAKSGFLAAMSHEIRTPMNAVLGILGLLRDTPLDVNQKHLVQTCRDSGELLLAIINDILDFSKMEAEKLELENTAFDLHHMFAQSVDLFQAQAARKDLNIILHLASDLPRYASGDPDRIRQILLNLINNAIKFTNDGVINVTASVTPEKGSEFHLHCEIQDAGIGIPEDQQQNLFEEFTMADQSHSRKHEGTGLGLAICKRLVELMNGHIDLHSEVGKGSTFFFIIELAHAKANEVELKGSDENTEPPSSDTRILLAEDNPANQMVIRSILEHAGLKIDIVANGLEAVEAVSTLPYDLVLMDISMPLMDGMQATQAIRDLSGNTRSIPIIALTAHALAGDREHFLAAGMDDYLTKPIDRAAALQCITRWSKVAQSKQASVVNAEPKSAITTENKLVDETVLQQLVNDTDAEIVPELLRGYIDDSRTRLLKIIDAINNKDIKTLQFETHTLGSSAAAHGNTTLCSQSREIEKICQKNRTGQALSKAKKLINTAKLSLDKLEERLLLGFNADVTTFIKD